MLDDITAIEIDVFDQRAAIFAVKDDMLVFSRRPTAFHHHADRVWRTHGGVRDIGWNEECLPFPNEMIDDAIAFTDANFYVALELVEIFLRIDFVEIVTRIRTFDDHDKKIAAIVEITIAHRRLEEMAVLFDPILQIDWRLHRRGSPGL